MKGLVLTIGAVAAALSLTFGLSVASASSSSAAAGTKVGVASSNLGRILVDARGRTLYLFARDRNGKSACSGTCAVYWPPLIASGKPHAVAGAKPTLELLHAEATDQLDFETFGVGDTVASGGLAAGAIQLFVDGVLVP